MLYHPERPTCTSASTGASCSGEQRPCDRKLVVPFVSDVPTFGCDVTSVLVDAIVVNALTCVSASSVVSDPSLESGGGCCVTGACFHDGRDADACGSGCTKPMVGRRSGKPLRPGTVPRR